MYSKICFSAFLIIRIFSEVILLPLTPDEPITVQLLKPSGSIVKGHLLLNENGGEYFAFQDIPYAEPPVGENRFKKPIYSRGWNGTLDATKNVKLCPQPQHQGTTEDCLVINLYTPINPKNDTLLLPVMLWIHGGGFLYGSGSIDEFSPKFLIQENIIVVTLNYRLGPFGFLSTEDGVIPGNLGLRDQQLAIEWVYNNILQFGGDPKRITISGESVGATSVGWHLLNVNQSINNFFHGAILASGTALCSFASRPEPRIDAFNLGYALDNTFNSTKSTDLLELLLNATTEEVISKCNPAILLTPYLPVIEKGGDDFSVPQTDAMDHGRFVKVPTLIGFNSEEMLTLWGSPNGIKMFSKLSTEVILGLLRFQLDDMTMHELANTLTKLYTKGHFAEDIHAMMKFTSDMAFTAPIFRHVEDTIKYAPHYSPYLYQFSYKPSVDPENAIPDMPGVGHGEDLNLVWDTNKQSAKYSVTDKLMSQRFVRIFANFVKTLNPNPSPDPLLENIKWPVASESKLLAYLDLNVDLKIMDNPRNYTYLRDVLYQYLQKPITGF